MRETMTAAALVALMTAVAPAAFAAGSDKTGATGSTMGSTAGSTTGSTLGTTGSTSGTTGLPSTTMGSGSSSGTIGTTGSTTMGTTGAPRSVTATEMQPGQIRGSDLKGSDIHNSKDEKIGSVKDLVLDPDGRVARVVVEVDGKNVGLRMEDLTIATNETGKPRITVNKTEAELKAAQTFDLEAPTATGTSTPPANSGSR